MGFDSVELIIEWEKFFEIKIPDVEAQKIASNQVAVDYTSFSRLAQSNWVPQSNYSRFF